MKVAIRQVQTVYAEGMQAHGYGNRTFRFETDARASRWFTAWMANTPIVTILTTRLLRCLTRLDGRLMSERTSTLSSSITVVV